MIDRVYTIFGATGFIGSRLAGHLRQQGHDVFTPARDSLISPTLFLGHAIYCIGLTANFRGRPFATVDAHVGRLREILEHGQFRSFTYLSSTRVYKNASITAEDAPLLLRPEDPDDLYNTSKVMGEALCLNCGRPETKVVRLSNVFGPDSGSENFLSSTVRAAIAEGRIVLRTAADSAKDYVAIDDVVGMLPKISEQGRVRIYNLASGVNTTHGRIIDAVRSATGCSVVYEAGAPKIEFPPISIARIRQEFHFVPALVLDQLPDLVRQMKEKLRAA
jgi:nucleoside-diphosphate-sugar epimerase